MATSCLRPCPACSRHVRAAERTCAFCRAPQPERGCAPSYERALSRAAVVFAVVACGKTQSTEPHGTAAPPYGPPPIDTPDAPVLAPLPTVDAEAPPPIPKGEAAIGPVKTSAPIADVEAALKPFHGRFQACYQRGLVKDPNMTGKVVLTAKVAANGMVASASVAENTGIDSLSASCMAAVLKKVSFKGPGVDVTMTLPITLHKKTP